ncbi:MAG: hypothetical protein WBI74_00070 [Caldicoprobacterales bacterium]|nr:hypothetical protein [Clostridiales bacterium]
MSKIKVADFYYGAVLSMLLSNGVKPVLIESDTNRQVYDITTNNEDCRLFMKYRADKQNIKTQDYNSWFFSFTDRDKEEIKRYIEEGYNLVIALICGVADLAESEVAVLDKDQIQELIRLDKDSITISRKKNEKAYRIPLDGGRENAMQVKVNRFEELF